MIRPAPILACDELATPDHDGGAVLAAPDSFELAFSVRLRVVTPSTIAGVSAVVQSAAALVGCARMYGLGDLAVSFAEAVQRGVKLARVAR